MMYRRLAPILLVAVGLAQPALAQINPFRGSKSTPLSGEDLAALTEATNRLLDRPQLTPGETEPWGNPKSGVSGIATAGAAVQRKGFACRIVTYEATVPGPRPQRKANLTWCKTKDGWKIG